VGRRRIRGAVPVTRECGLVRWKAPTRSVELRDVSSACRISWNHIWVIAFEHPVLKYLRFFTRHGNDCWIITVRHGGAWGLGRGRVERMSGPGDVYRLRTADMFAQAARNLRPWQRRSFVLSMRQIATDKGSCRWTRMILPPIIKRSSNRRKQQQQRTLEQKHHRPGER
jgi:hypothetical protein